MAPRHSSRRSRGDGVLPDDETEPWAAAEKQARRSGAEIMACARSPDMAMNPVYPHGTPGE
jgi:hypothetical protein